MFYLGAAKANGQPYIRYRGGSIGFSKVIDERTLGFADSADNRQYITLGNLPENPKGFNFLVDCANSQRVKLRGTAEVSEDGQELMNPLRDGNYTGKVESAIRFHLETWDVNCQQYIHKRFSERQITPGIEKLHSRALELETQLAALRDQADCQPDAGTGTLTLLGLAVMPVLGNPTRVSSRDAHH